MFNLYPKDQPASSSCGSLGSVSALNKEVVYRNRDGHVMKFSVAKNESEILLENSTFVTFKVAKYSVSPDLRFVLLAYDVKQAGQTNPTVKLFVTNLYGQTHTQELTPPASFKASDAAPGSQLVTDRFLLDWDSVLVSSHDVIVARFDGRGSGFQGERVLQAVHQQLGIVDVQDQIAAIEYLKKLPYIDPDRIGIFGKGYGGYITLMMLKSTDELKCAVAMSPVTEWKLYANIHFQHSAELIKHLIKAGANYTMQHTQRLRCWLRGSTIVRPPQRISMTTVWIELSRVHLWGLQVGTFHPQCFVD
ncbi:UNVERIFIED_CONTAM: hypothetical protein FKN15_017703 [Acipenser sinensis]